MEAINPEAMESDLLNSTVDEFLRLLEEIEDAEAKLKEQKARKEQLAMEIPELFAMTGTEAIVRNGKRVGTQRVLSVKAKDDMAKQLLMQVMRELPEGKHLIKDSLHMGSFKTWCVEFLGLEKGDTSYLDLPVDEILEQLPPDVVQYIEVESFTRASVKKA